MANEPRPDDVRHLWQQQPRENTPVSLDEIRNRATRFEGRINRRNLREYIAGLVCLVVFGCYIWKLQNPLVRVGSGMIMAGVVFVMWQLHRRGAATPLPQDLAVTASLEFHRRQLIQQRDLLRTVFRWYLTPFIPGMLVFLIGTLPPGGLELRYLPRMAPFLVLLVGTLGAVWWMNRAAAAKLDGQIAELDRLEKQP